MEQGLRKGRAREEDRKRMVRIRGAHPPRLPPLRREEPHGSRGAPEHGHAISGYKTVSVFLRYNIVSTEQLHSAMEKVTAKKAK